MAGGGGGGEGSKRGRKSCTYLGCTDDLSSSTLAFRSTFDDSRQIKNLDFCSTIFKDARNGRQCCERVCRDNRLGLGDL